MVQNPWLLGKTSSSIQVQGWGRNDFKAIYMVQPRAFAPWRQVQKKSMLKGLAKGETLGPKSTETPLLAEIKLFLHLW